MEKVNIHPKKLYSLIIAAASMLGLILPWVVINLGGFGGFGGGSQSSNGFGGWGLLTLLGIVGVTIACLMEDKLKDFDKNMKMAVTGGFVAITLGAFIVFMQLTGNRTGMGGAKTGVGLWITLLSGIAGLLWVTGVIKPASKKPGTPS